MNNADTELKEKTPKGPAAWMVTFTDLVSLMLTFFVMLFAMSNVKTDEWQDAVDALAQQLNPSQQKHAAAATAEYNISTVYRRRAINLDYLTSILEKALAEDDLLDRATLMRLDDRLVIALPVDLLFPSGQAVLSPGAKQALFDLGGILQNIGNTITVNGHTDPVRQSGTTYRSNWELSTARAVAVANLLRLSGYTKEIIAFGYADSMFHQLPEISEEPRKRLGRRVDIIVLATVG